MHDGKFRRDLYFRLQVVEIAVPPLRERRSDIPLLAEHFLAKFAAETGRRVLSFTPAALEKMERYDWPGNVRELRNVVERAVALAKTPALDTVDIWLSTLSSPEIRQEYEPLTLDEVEKRHILKTLEHTDWNKSQAALILAIERSTLDRKIKGYGIRRDDEVTSLRQYTRCGTVSDRVTRPTEGLNIQPPMSCPFLNRPTLRRVGRPSVGRVTRSETVPQQNRPCSFSPPGFLAARLEFDLHLRVVNLPVFRVGPGYVPRAQESVMDRANPGARPAVEREITGGSHARRERRHHPSGRCDEARRSTRACPRRCSPGAGERGSLVLLLHASRDRPLQDRPLRLGSGGMSKVYHRSTRSSDRPGRRDQGPSARHDRSAPMPSSGSKVEFRSARKLDHPSIVRAHEMVVEAGLVYLVLELVDGPSLSQLLREKTCFSEAKAVRWMTQIAEALAVAHANQLVHRDIKPGNILIGADGRAKLADLGLAKDLVAKKELTQ